MIRKRGGCANAFDVSQLEESEKNERTESLN